MKPTGVLMIGSVPGTSPTEVFTRLTTALPRRLEAVPDGETGERWNYIGWQRECFPRLALRIESGGLQPTSESPTFALADIKSTGYDEAALSSYTEFQQLRQKSIIPRNVRFQISLPSPYSVVLGHIKPEMANMIEPLYEERFAETVNRIMQIPHNDMVIQYDLCFEMTALEFEQGRLHDTWHKCYFAAPNGDDLLNGLVDRIERISRHISEDVRLAFHLCYGDLRHRHFVEPRDTALMVTLANALLSRECLGRRTEWIHLPVPKERMDPEYFEPLAGLKLNRSGSQTPRLYLGVVHANDETGTKKRIETAQACVPFPFGVSTECGLGRTPPGEIDSILRICNEVTE